MKGTRKNSFQKIFVNLLQRLVIKETQRSSDACVFISLQLKKIYSTLTTVSGPTVEKEMFCRYFRVCNVVENNENC